MKMAYDSEVDVLTIRLNNRTIARSEEVRRSVILDLDAEGGIVGLEILDASRRVDDPRTVELKVQE